MDDSTCSVSAGEVKPRALLTSALKPDVSRSVVICSRVSKAGNGAVRSTWRDERFDDIVSCHEEISDEATLYAAFLSRDL